MTLSLDTAAQELDSCTRFEFLGEVHGFALPVVNIGTAE